tara:strand:- start:723 stop:1592 length:870 start_codon:yes stop_codon:yes gene_type:complete
MSTNTIVVTVQGSGNGKFYMDGNEGVLALKYGDTYIFDVGDSTNTNKPLFFSLIEDGIHNSGSNYNFSNFSRSGNVGQPGSTIQLTVDINTPTNLFFYSTNYDGMGNGVLVNNNGTIPPYRINMSFFNQSNSRFGSMNFIKVDNNNYKRTSGKKRLDCSVPGCNGLIHKIYKDPLSIHANKDTCYNPTIKQRENKGIYTEPVHGNQAYLKHRCRTFKQREFNFALENKDYDKKIYQANCVCNTKVTYNKSNRKFSNQGAVSNRSRINRLKYNTRVITNQKIENKNDRFK